MVNCRRIGLSMVLTGFFLGLGVHGAGRRFSVFDSPGYLALVVSTLKLAMSFFPTTGCRLFHSVVSDTTWTALTVRAG